MQFIYSFFAAVEKFTVTLVILTTFLTSAWAHEYTVKNVRIVHPFAIPTVPAQANGAVYFSLENSGKDTARLVRASSPVAQRVELHQMSMDGNVMRMRAVTGIAVKGGETTKLDPNGYHLMLVSLKKPLKEGDKFPLVLEFDGIGKADVSVLVQKAKEGGDHAGEHSH